MTKLIQIFSAIASVVVFSAVITPSKSYPKEFIRIGSFNNQQKEIIAYFLSVNPTSWTTAKQDCHNILGPQGSLASIKTSEELTNFKEKIAFLGNGTAYWVGGEFKNEKWTWLTGDLFELWIQWHGTRAPPIGSKVSKVYYLKNDSEFDTAEMTVPLRYICEKRQA